MSKDNEINDWPTLLDALQCSALSKEDPEFLTSIVKLVVGGKENGAKETVEELFSKLNTGGDKETRDLAVIIKGISSAATEVHSLCSSVDTENESFPYYYTLEKHARFFKRFSLENPFTVKASPAYGYRQTNPSIADAITSEMTPLIEARLSDEMRGKIKEVKREQQAIDKRFYAKAAADAEKANIREAYDVASKNKSPDPITPAAPPVIEISIPRGTDKVGVRLLLTRRCHEFNEATGDDRGVGDVSWVFKEGSAIAPPEL